MIALTRVVYKLLNSVQRNLNNGNVFFPNIAGMGFGFLVSDISDNIVAIGSFGAISVVVILYYLTHLIHKPEFWIQAEFFEFSMLL